MTQILRSKLFWAGLLVRAACLPFFGSHYICDLFVPFLDSAVLNPLANPWAQAPAHYFPYGSVLFALLFVPRWVAYHLVGSAALGAGALGLTLIKVPLLILDVCLLGLLARLAPQRSQQITLYYWLNPVLFFITYVHGQLDVAAMTFFVACLYALLHQRTFWSGFLFAMAMLCKAHVIIVAPFILAYLWNRHFARTALRHIGVWLATFASVAMLGFVPLLQAQRFGYAVATSPEAFRLFAVAIDLGHESHTIYVGVAIVLAILGRLCIATHISNYGLVYGSGILFGALVLVTSAMPGWYFWFLPFVALFYANYVTAPRSLFWICCALYLLYFGVLTEWDVALPSLMKGVAFTLTQTGFAGVIVVMWAVAVRTTATLQGRIRPLMIGIAGDSGTGKNMLSTTMSDLFTDRRMTIIEGDDYHRWERGNQKWSEYTHLHPKANALDAMETHTDELASGRLVFHPQYDHETGQFTSPRMIRGNKTIIVQGLHALYLRGMRERLDLRIFLAPHALIRLSWKIRRDALERGHSIDHVLENLRRREVDARLHIEPQRQLADWIIEAVPQGPLTREDVLQGAAVDVAFNHILWNDAPIGELYEALREHTPYRITLQDVPGDIDRILLHIEGVHASRAEIEAVGKRLYPHLRHVTRGWSPPHWHAGHAGVNQLIAVALLTKRSYSHGAIHPASRQYH